MKFLHSSEILYFFGLGGKSTFFAFEIIFSSKISLCVLPCPKGLLPNNISKNITPVDQISTLCDILTI